MTPAAWMRTGDTLCSGLQGVHPMHAIPYIVHEMVYMRDHNMKCPDHHTLCRPILLTSSQLARRLQSHQVRSLPLDQLHRHRFVQAPPVGAPRWRQRSQPAAFHGGSAHAGNSKTWAHKAFSEKDEMKRKKFLHVYRAACPCLPG